jgi:hypothetical protein
MADEPTPDRPPRDEPAPDPDVDLIAYLDGELDGPEAEAVEARLALDPAARTRADSYKKTFDLLDYLPRPEPSADFATRTLTRLQPATGYEPRATRSGASASRVARRSPLLPWLLAGVLAAVGGYVAHAALRQFVDRPAGSGELSYDDVRVIENLPLYLGVDDLGFLRALDDADLFEPKSGAGADPSAGPHLDVQPADRGKLEALYATYRPARRLRLRELDQQLRELPAAEREHLARVLEGYAVWLDRLPDSDRREVLAADSADARLDTVRRVRERAWRDALPAKARDRLMMVASEQERLGLVEARKAAERARREEWQLARRQWDDLRPDRKPWPFSDPDLARGVDEYVKTVLRVPLPTRTEPKRELPSSARVTPSEYADLRPRYIAAVNGGGGWDWFSYGLVAYRLSRKHPYLPPFGDREPLTDVPDLPTQLVRELRAKGGLQTGERRWPLGKWPEFALEVDAAADRAGVKLARQLGPARPGEFAPAVNTFLDELLPKLTPAERDGLAKLEGVWPEYPRAFLSLAAKHDLPVPGVTLPGRPSQWARFYSPAPGKE